ncbi:MAG: hypothetical protein E7588_01360 [Ruminococcaceae bacterium]|nr:hypothetical protein [Oscillospiraceae bacterium]
MKKTIYFMLLMIAVLCLVSCQKDEDFRDEIIIDYSKPNEALDAPTPEAPNSAETEKQNESVEDENENNAVVTEKEPPASQPVGGSDYTFSREWMDETYNLYIASVVVGRESSENWVNEVFLKKTPQEMDALPNIYMMIVDLGISKEDLIKANNEYGSGDLTPEMIDALYLDDVEDVKKALMNPNALYCNGNVYTFDKIKNSNGAFTEIPVEVLADYLNDIQELCVRENTIKYMLEEINFARSIYGIEASEYDFG